MACWGITDLREGLKSAHQLHFRRHHGEGERASLLQCRALSSLFSDFGRNSSLFSDFGREGFRKLYKAHAVTFNRWLIAKVFGWHLASESNHVNRLLRELGLAIGLIHPNIVKMGRNVPFSPTGWVLVGRVTQVNGAIKRGIFSVCWWLPKGLGRVFTVTRSPGKDRMACAFPDCWWRPSFLTTPGDD